MLLQRYTNHILPNPCQLALFTNNFVKMLLFSHIPNNAIHYAIQISIIQNILNILV